eukprot:gene37633-33352_t
MSSEAFGVDVVKELVDAARRGGVAPGLYFSHADWYDPDLRLDPINNLMGGGKLPRGATCVGAPCDASRYNASTSPVAWRRGVLTKYGELLELSLDV